MEGHGVWRSDNGACEAGVHYRKDDLLCVCNEDGKWPNPVCRDIFQILHSVETTEHEEPVKNKSCSATKLYLFGCNVCFCPSSGKIDPKLCTNKPCEDENEGRPQTKDTAEEVYASCNPNKSYKLGCQTCMCLRNNRLICDNCSSQDDHKRLTGHNTECHLKKPGEVFKKDCNFCHCDRNGTIYCTAKKCLETHTELSLPNVKYTLADKVEDEPNCVPFSKYKKDCNTCHCFMVDGVKYFGCSMKTCKLTTDISFDTSCVEGTSYELNCMTCHCVVNKGIKREFCTVNDICIAAKNTLPRKLLSMHGYCEPMHVYQQDCNKCRCLADGKTVACTSKICSKKKGTKKAYSLLKNFKNEAKIKTERPAADNSLIMEFIPFVQRGYVCPKGQTYMVGCNICHCMKTGNVVCTTKQC